MRRCVPTRASIDSIGTSIAGRRLDEEAFEEFWATAAQRRLRNKLWTEIKAH